MVTKYFKPSRSYSYTYPVVVLVPTVVWREIFSGDSAKCMMDQTLEQRRRQNILDNKRILAEIGLRNPV